MRQAVADTIFSRIMGIISAKDVWSTLQEESIGNAKIHVIKFQIVIVSLN